MNSTDLFTLSPFIALGLYTVIIMIVIAWLRDHRITVLLTLTGFLLSGASLFLVSLAAPRQVTPLLMIDQYALLYMGLVIMAGFSVAVLSYAYLKQYTGHQEEFYPLLILAVLGCMVLTAATHFASLFLGIELLSVSLYALTAYLRHSVRGIEAGVKYLLLAAVSSAFILFGMALVYAETGTMEFGMIAAQSTSPGAPGLSLIAGFVMIIAGLGFKLAVVPFHLWTPDVYEGAPAPVTAFIATASKGAVFALLLRFLAKSDLHHHAALAAIITTIAVSSMFAGNLLALLQTNVKRLLAYSSISHLGYLLVTVLASGPLALTAAAMYLFAYFLTTLAAFGVVIMLSDGTRDADRIEDYQGLAWKRPWLTVVFTLMLLSLAGIPMTAGFVGKFFVAASGVGSALWFAVIVLAINSVIGLYYYLRLIMVLFTRPESENAACEHASLTGGMMLAALALLMIWIGLYPGPVIEIIRGAVLF